MPNATTQPRGLSNAAVNEMIAKVSKSECVLFLGAGIHAPPQEGTEFVYEEKHRPPLGKALSNSLAKEFRLDQELPEESPDDLQRVSLFIETTDGLGRKVLVDALDRNLAKGKRPSPALKMLAAMPFSIIVTTNFDRLVETALIQAGKQPEVIVYDPDPKDPTPDMSEDPTVQRPMLFKLHGCLSQRSSIVVTDEDYIRFVQRMSNPGVQHPVPKTILYRMGRWPTLFLGYSLKDYNLRLLFRTLRERMDSSAIPPSFSVDSYPDPLILRVWQNRNGYLTFLSEDLWNFVPWLHGEVTGG